MRLAPVLELWLLNLYTPSTDGRTIIMFSQKVALLRNTAAEASATPRHSTTLLPRYCFDQGGLDGLYYPSYILSEALQMAAEEHCATRDFTLEAPET